MTTTKLTDAKRPRVVIQVLDGGELRYFSDNGDVEILVIDETCERDRVYRLGNHAAAAGTIDNLIGGDPIGMLGDMPEIEEQIREHIETFGKPDHLN